MMKLLIFLLFISPSLFAGVKLAPPNFDVQGKKAVWVDFKLAEYQLRYDVTNSIVEVETRITFEQKEKGYPLFDSKNKISSLTLNGEKTEQKLISSPQKVTKVRLINKELEPGTHSMTMTSSMTTGVSFNLKRKNWGSVSSAFFIRDLRDRMLLERYLPTNLEYDSYKMIMDVEVVGTKRFHSLFANGDITKLTENHYRVEFPDYYVSSSVYFHLVPVNKFVRWYLKYPSIDGRKIPVTIYSSYRFYNKMVKKKAWVVMKELEADYGPWPHEKLIIYGTGIKGGMEYAGATETSIISLGHELQHSYFAKGIHPANGNAGWLDEAIASWRDKGHQTLEKPFYQSANLGNQSLYTRKTDKRSYEYGRSFMAYMDFKLKANGKVGLKDFLGTLVEKRMHSSITTEDFKKDLESYSGLDLTSDFNQYIYGEDKDKRHHHKHSELENPHHPIIDFKTLESIL